MNKLYLISIFLITFFISCTNEESNNSLPLNPVLIKKITETIYYSDQQETRTVNFNYENNILKSYESNSYRNEFVYDGDKITQINRFLNNEAIGFSTYNYNGNFLNYILSGNNQDQKTKYIYQNNILTNIENSYFNGTENVILLSKDLTYNSANNIDISINTDSFFPPTIISKEVYTYDAKNNPMRDMNKYFRLAFTSEGFNGLTTNNVISRDSFYPITSTTPNQYNYEIIYNSDDFPTEIRKIQTINNALISKTVIEYQ